LEAWLGKSNLFIISHYLVKLVPHFNSAFQRWKFMRSSILYAVD